MCLKKGSIIDLFGIIVVLFVLGIVIIMALTISDKITPRLQEKFGAGTKATEIVTNINTAMPLFDSVFMFAAIGLSIFVIISAFAIKTHPIFFFISIFLLVILMVIAPPISNAFVEVANTTTFLNATENLPMSVTLMQNLPLFGLVIGVLLSIVLYGKIRGD